jgi:hypothetical protein
LELARWGPKTYRRRETLTTFVDSHDYNLLQLVDFIGESFVWGSKQYISLWRALEYDCIEIATDEQLLEWFELNKDKGEVNIVGQINDFEGPLQFSPTKRRLHPTVRVHPSTAPIDLDPFIDPMQLHSTKQPAKEDKKVHSKVSDEVLSDSSYDSELAAAATQVRGGRPPIGRGRGGAPLKLEEGDHQLEGAGEGRGGRRGRRRSASRLAALLNVYN